MGFTLIKISTRGIIVPNCFKQSSKIRCNQALYIIISALTYNILNILTIFIGFQQAARAEK